MFHKLLYVTKTALLSAQSNRTCSSTYSPKEKRPKSLMMVQSCLWRDKELRRAIEPSSASGIDLHFEAGQKNSGTP